MDATITSVMPTDHQPQPMPPNWTQTVPAIIAVVGMLLTVVGTSSAVLSKIELVRADVMNLKTTFEENNTRLDRRMDDYEARIRVLERTCLEGKQPR